MNALSPEIAATPAKRARNWWKVAFFVALLAFEGAREWAVIETDSPIQPAAIAGVTKVGGLIMAEGRWRRIDQTDDLMPNAVSIQCWQGRGTCTEATSNSLTRDTFGTPEVNTLDASFTPDAVSYSNDYPCVIYSVRIDLKLEKVFAVREAKKNHPKELCQATTQRIEMRLGNGFEDGDLAKRKKHFVPVMKALVAVMEVF